ncbi:nephrin-like isoform X2 [Watersipora subatra]|uniref:nephrin-like isoform X2 n=1 Tax=Watersipora subatra TaxID=2589382 RepID=UPI00355AE557
MYYLLIAVFFVCFRSVSAQVSLNAIESEVYALKNKSAVLDCQFFGNIDLKWTLPNGITYFMSRLNSDGSIAETDIKFEFTQNNIIRLSIPNVQPTDDGVYRCWGAQVDDASQSASVFYTLHVVVKPGIPKISGSGGTSIEPSPSGQAIKTLNVPYELKEAQVKCIVGPAKPAINIKWFKDEEEITTGISSLAASENEEKLETTSSILTIPDITEHMTGDIYKCVADLSELPSPYNSGDSPQQLFNLSVHVPPSEPIISGYRDGQVIQAGLDITLKCTVIGGNPLPSLTWYRNDEQLSVQYDTNEGSKTVVSEHLVYIQPSDNNAVYRCDANNPALEQPRSEDVTFSVQFPPAEVTITGNEQVKIGEATVLSCTTSDSNPKSSITWLHLGSSLPADDQVTKYTESSAGYITQTNITITAERQNHNGDYTCRAANDVPFQDAVKTVTLDVLYPPDTIRILGIDPSHPVNEGEVVTATCTSIDGNPLPKLVWYKGDTVIDRVGEAVTRNKTKILELEFIAKPEDNGATYKCSAESSASATPKETSAVTAVYFPPLNVTITPKTDLKADMSQTLTCSSGSSFPQASIAWYKNDSQVFVGISGFSVADGLYGGKVTSSRYTFIPTSSDNGLTVACRATSGEISRTMSLPLNVLHKPIFSGAVAVIDVQEGKNLTGTDFSAQGNPADITYAWFQVAADGTETELTLEAKRDGALSEMKVEGGVLNLHNVARARSGAYRVKATNTEGTTSHDFEINVQYGAGIPNSPTQEYNDGVLKLHCTIDSNPPVTLSQAKWTRLDYDMARATPSIDGEGTERTITLTISGVVREDVGTFTCEAENAFGIVTKEYTVTPVPFQPVIDKSPSVSKSAAQTRENGVIKCTLDAYPQPSVVWSRGGTELAGEKYQQSTETEGQIHFSFVLTVVSVGEEDYGTYTCLATNDRGSETHDYILSGTSIPDPPTDLEVLNMTYDSAILTWVPGFNGGLDQFFTVMYFIPGPEAPVRLYADVNAPPFTLTGLQAKSSYKITVQATNELGSSAFLEPPVSVTTGVTPSSTTPAPRPEEPMFIIIMVLAVVGGLLLIVTTVLICVFVRRRRRRKSSEGTDSVSQTNTVELFGTNHDGSYYNDDVKSYSTYDKGLDDDYSKHYEGDNSNNHIRDVTDDATYISPRSVPPNNQPPPWTRSEDPLGNSGTYGRLHQSIASLPTASTDQQYAQLVRNVDRSLRYTAQPVERPAFVRGRPSAPKAPGKISNIPNGLGNPLTPDRNYSPIVSYSPVQDITRGDLV